MQTGGGEPLKGDGIASIERDQLVTAAGRHMAPDELPGLLFHDPGCEAARAMFTPPDDPEAAIAAIVGMSVAWKASVRSLSW